MVATTSMCRLSRSGVGQLTWRASPVSSLVGEGVREPDFECTERGDGVWEAKITVSKVRKIETRRMPSLWLSEKQQ